MGGQQRNERRDDEHFSAERDDECGDTTAMATSPARPMRDAPRRWREDDRVRHEQCSDDCDNSLNDAVKRTWLIEHAS